MAKPVNKYSVSTKRGEPRVDAKTGEPFGLNKNARRLRKLVAKVKQ